MLTRPHIVTFFTFLMVVLLCICQPSALASGYSVGAIPDVQNYSWSKLGTVVVDAESSCLTNGDLLMMRLSDDCRFYHAEPIVTGPVLEETAAGKQATYTVSGDKKGQLRIVVPEKVKGNSNDLFAATGQDPFEVSTTFDNEIIVRLQNYQDGFAENRFLVCLDEAYAVADPNKAVKLYFDALPGSGWPAHDTAVAGYDFRCPHAPTDLIAVPASETEIDLTWNDNSVNEKGFIILSKQGTDPYKEIDRVQADKNAYSVAGLLPDTPYSFQVKAFSADCDSPPSNIAQATTLKPDEPDEPLTNELVFKIGSPTYYLNNTAYQMDTFPIIQESRTYLPIRYLAEALGAEVEWKQAENKVTIHYDKTVVKLWIGKPQALVNDLQVLIDTENPWVVPELTDSGRTVLPVRFIAESLNCNIDWDGKSQEAKVTW